MITDVELDAEALAGWLEALDTISHYELLGAQMTATHDELRAAFHAFAEDFHPDGHAGRPPEEQEAVARIYRRGAEAWRVLSDAMLRAHYDAALASGAKQPEAVVVAKAAGQSLAPPPARLVDTVKAPGARPFVLRAEELLKKGDPKQAKLQLVMALHMDRGNTALEEFAKTIERAIAEQKR